MKDRAYQFPLPNLTPEMQTILDVGPGQFPLPQATRCFDVDDTWKEHRLVPCDMGTVELLPYRANEFEYVYASHVLEHVHDPLKAIRELQRVGKYGYLEMPSVMLDWFCQHGNVHTRWMCLQSNNAILFVARPANLVFSDEQQRNTIHRFIHYDIPLSDNDRQLREFFWDNQKTLNISAAWTPSHRIEAMVL